MIVSVTHADVSLKCGFGIGEKGVVSKNKKTRLREFSFAAALYGWKREAAYLKRVGFKKIISIIMQNAFINF